MNSDVKSVFLSSAATFASVPAAINVVILYKYFVSRTDPGVSRLE